MRAGKDVRCYWKVQEGNSCYKVVENLSELCSAIEWKIELVNNNYEYSAEEISKLRVEGAAWFLLDTSSKMWEKEIN